MSTDTVTEDPVVVKKKEIALKNNQELGINLPPKQSEPYKPPKGPLPRFIDRFGARKQEPESTPTPVAETPGPTFEEPTR